MSHAPPFLRRLLSAALRGGRDFHRPPLCTRAYALPRLPACLPGHRRQGAPRTVPRLSLSCVLKPCSGGAAHVHVHVTSKRFHECFRVPRHLDVNRVSAENRWVGNTTAESLASSTKVGDDVSGIMLGAYARARHAVRRAGRGASVGEGLPARVTSEPCRTGRYCADACAARVGRLL
jgi:hypothetical protein